MDIQCRTGQSNARADALSRSPVQLSLEDCKNTDIHVSALVAQVEVTLEDTDDNLREYFPEDNDLREQHLMHDELCQLMDYLEQGELPESEKKTREIVRGIS